MLRIDQTPPIVNGITYDDKIRIQQRVVLRRGGIEELKPVLLRPARAHVVDEWLVEIAEEARREWGIVSVLIVVAAAASAGGGGRVGLADAPGDFNY